MAPKISSDVSCLPPELSFETRLEDAKISKSAINCMIMDYLVSEGYPRAAKNFAVEGNVPLEPDPVTIQQRVAIRKAIYSDNVLGAIKKINEFDSTLLEKDPYLHFSLLRLHFIGLVHACVTSEEEDLSIPLNFASTHLAPRASTDANLLKQLEEAMALLIFPLEDLERTAPQLLPLIDPQLRADIATRVNEVILDREGLPRQSRVRSLLSIRNWAEDKTRSRGLPIPARLDHGLENEKGLGTPMNLKNLTSQSDDDDEMVI